MKDYYLDIKHPEDGHYILHQEGCPNAPKAENRKRLGLHPTCHLAFIKAKTIQPKIDGCPICCSPCHMRKFNEH